MPWILAWQKGRSTKAQNPVEDRREQPDARAYKQHGRGLDHPVPQLTEVPHEAASGPSGLDCRCDAAMRVTEHARARDGVT